MTIFIIDDDPSIVALLTRVARGLNFDVVGHGRGLDALAHMARVRPDAVLVDLRLPDVDGVDVLRAVNEQHPSCPVVLITGHPTVDSAIEALRLGALDYLTKPFHLERLQDVLVTIQKRIERRETLLKMDTTIAKQFEFYGMIGRSAPIQELFDSIRRLAPHLRTLLITGETGTGKELVARALQKLGPRRTRRFLTINCSAVVDTLFESELFGHERGAFTGASATKTGLLEHADGGTLFLDEVGELPLGLQAKLLRAVEYGEIHRLGALQSQQVDVCVIAATNRDLGVEAAAGRFRSDLYYRLTILEIHIPPLRERREDIPLLTAAFIRECAARTNRSITGITTSAERLLQQMPWHGNVRELRNVIERACLLSDSRILSDQHILAGTKGLGAQASPDTAIPLPTPGPFDPAADRLLSSAQRAQIQRVLKQVGGNKTEAARLLGISRRSLYRWLGRLADPPGEL